jgi:hypothetical protein
MTLVFVFSRTRVLSIRTSSFVHVRGFFVVFAITVSFLLYEPLRWWSCAIQLTFLRNALMLFALAFDPIFVLMAIVR